MPCVIATSNVWFITKLIHDCIYNFFQWLSEIAILLFASGTIKCYGKLHHFLLNNWIGTYTVVHAINEFLHYLLCSAGQLLVRNIFFNIEAVEFLLEDIIGQHGPHLCNTVFCEEALLRIFTPNHHMDVWMNSFIMKCCIPSKAFRWNSHGLSQLSFVRKY